MQKLQLMDVLFRTAMKSSLPTGHHRHQPRNILETESRGNDPSGESIDLTKREQIDLLYAGDRRHRDTKLQGLSLRQIRSRHRRVYAKNRKTSSVLGYNKANIDMLKTANASFNDRLNIINPDFVPLKGSLDVAGRPLKQTRLGERFAESAERPEHMAKKEKKAKKAKEKKQGTSFEDLITGRVKKWFAGEEVKDDPYSQGAFTKALNQSWEKLGKAGKKRLIAELRKHSETAVAGEGMDPARLRKYFFKQANRLAGL